jgi:hypothetical protein
MSEEDAMRVLLLMLGCGALCLGADEKKAANDGSGPRAALLLFDKIVGPNQAEKALPFYHATSTRERALAGVFAEIDGALADLHAKAKVKFGEEVADSMVSIVGAKTTREINEAKISVNGDAADVLFPGDEKPMQMVRVDGEWKISVKAMIKEFDQRAKDMRMAIEKVTVEVRKITKEIEQGKYESGEEPSRLLLEIRGKAFKKADE